MYSSSTLSPAPHLHHNGRANAVTHGHSRGTELHADLRNYMFVLLSEPA